MCLLLNSIHGDRDANWLFLLETFNDRAFDHLNYLRWGTGFFGFILSWSEQVNVTVNKANKLLGLVHRIVGSSNPGAFSTNLLCARF